jgi:hypothetical protein
MDQIKTTDTQIVQMLHRLPFSLKKRVEELKYYLSDKRKERVTNDEIVQAALESYLKKFGK